MRAFALLLLSACTQFDVLVEAASDEGTVYLCRAGEQSKELCFFDDSADELADRLGEGWSCGPPSRRWPALANALGMGCTYSCPAPGVGCNAKRGCYCTSEPSP